MKVIKYAIGNGTEALTKSVDSTKFVNLLINMTKRFRL